MITAPPVEPLDPAIIDWAPRRLFRVHHKRYRATQFNPGFGGGRFHPIRDENGEYIPTLYAANQKLAALSETVLHGLLAGDDLLFVELHGQEFSRIEPTRQLHLIDLTGLAIRRLGVSRADLLEAGEEHYAITARWAEALHRTVPDADGMIWISRQFDKANSLLLFGDRISETRLLDHKHTDSLERGAGLAMVRQACALAGICLVEG